jgi:hypothetical protein
MSGSSWLRRGASLISGLCLLAAADGSLGQTVFDVRHPVIAWWAVDPQDVDGAPPANPGRLAAPIARFISAEVPIGDGTPALGAAVLAGSLQCGVANRVVLVDLAGEPGKPGQDWKCEGLSIVVQAAAPSDEFERAVREAMGAMAQEGPLELPEGWAGRWFAVEGRPDWQRVEVGLGGGWTVVGLGSGVLAEWLAPGDGEGAAPATHRGARGQDGVPFFEVMVDLDRLRSAIPANFSQSQVGRALQAGTLANARACSMGIVRGAGSELAGAVSWASRSEPMAMVVGMPLQREVPGGAEGAPAGPVLALTLDPRRVVNRVLGVSRAWRTRFGMTEFDRQVQRWRQTRQGEMALNAIGRATMNVGIDLGADGGRLRVRVALPGAAPEEIVAAIESLPEMVKGEAGWRVPVLDEGDDPGGVLRAVQIAITSDGRDVIVEAKVIGP